jgi:hypothetical protein
LRVGIGGHRSNSSASIAELRRKRAEFAASATWARLENRNHFPQSVIRCTTRERTCCGKRKPDRKVPAQSLLQFHRREFRRLVDLGATLVEELDGDGRWARMTDPDAYEFEVLAAR